MITSIFGKSKPINFILCSGILLGYFLLPLFSKSYSFDFQELTAKIIVLCALIFSLLMIDFITKKNELSRQNNYVIFISTLYIGMFPTIFETPRIVFLYILLLLFYRRILSLKSLRRIKYKLFDSALFISIAFLFDSWSIVHFVLIYLAIVIYVSNNYKNWIIPLIGFICVLLIYGSYQYLYGNNILTNNFFKVDVNIYYETQNHRKMMLQAFLSFLFLINITTLFLKYKSYSSQKRISFLLIISMFLIGATHTIMTKQTIDNIELICIFPLAVLTANLLENMANNKVKNAFIFFLILIIFYLLFFIKTS